MIRCENKCNKCILRCVNLLHYGCRKPPIGFDYLLWPSSGRCFSKDIYITKNIKTYLQLPTFKFEVYVL